MTRQLSQQEIEQLQRNLCWAESWQSIYVSEDFDCSLYQSVRFSGEVRLGANNKDLSLPSGEQTRGGIYNASIHNTTIGQNTYIANVSQRIANYDIGEDCVIEGLGAMYVSSSTCFGNGTKISAINEGGGREVMIYDRLSSHLAYIMALYRHDTQLIERLEEMITDYCNRIRSTRGIIADGVTITNCGSIVDVKIGNGAIIDGAIRLNNGSINSSFIAPTRIGSGVIADHFIILDSSVVDSGVILDKTFVGQGCQLGRQFSSENSLFFANSVAMHGEACSLFGGPYTVTHHKSTLLIATMCSFYNAGSGSNQSNHMYKLGAFHQGILERGSKTGSNSYILFPCKIGAFTSVIGNHYSHTDSSTMPFSYLLSLNDVSYLVPGVNLRSVGTFRDATKWEKRDTRKGDKIDKVVFDMFNPFTISHIIKGLEDLKALDKGESQYIYRGCRVTGSALTKGIELYQIALDKFIGDVLNKNPQIAYNSSFIGQKWVDVSGLIAPQSEIDSLIEDITNRTLFTLEGIEQRFAQIYESYPSHLANFVSGLIEGDKQSYLNKWRSSSIILNEMLIDDARKEFSISSQSGYGIDGDDQTKTDDFRSVRGEFEQNSTIKEIMEQIKELQG